MAQTIPNRVSPKCAQPNSKGGQSEQKDFLNLDLDRAVCRGLWAARHYPGASRDGLELGR